MQEIITFDVYIDDEEMTGVDKISLVKKPAIMTDFIYMNEDEMPNEYKQINLSDDDKMIITGPALIPDLPIIRKDEDDEPYFIKYSSEQIEKIAQKFFKLRNAHEVNKDHKENKAEDTYIFESWIVGENDKSQLLGFDVPKGTWMVSMKVENEELWNQIKSGKYRGFSIEGLFKFKRSSRLVKQERLLRRNLKSSNVDAILYDTELKEMVIRFKEGDIYTYFDIEFDTYRSVVTGTGGVTRTSGKSEYGSWEVGKTPSIGAAVWEQLIDKRVSYQKGGSMTLSEDVELESYTDYPKQASENAKIALRWAEENGWGDCGTGVGKARANQLANGEAISRDTIARMAAFERHRQNSDKELGDGCGRLMWLAWGGDAGIEWAQRKLESIDKEINASNSNIDMESKVSLVKPGESENEQEFISRCMGDDKMNSEFPDQEQRAAVCYTYWSEKQEKINIDMASAILKDGNTLHTDAETMAVGVEVYFKDENGNKMTVDNGEYELEDGTVVFVEDSKIKEIKEMEMGANYDKEKEEDMMRDKEKEKTKMEIDPMLMEQFDALKGMIENLNLKIDALMAGEVSDEMMSKVEQVETKLEKVLVSIENKKTETVDDLKKVAQSEVKRTKLDHDLIVKYNKKF